MNLKTTLKTSISSNDMIPCNIHMAGLITLEDVIERLIRYDIMDESDVAGQQTARRAVTEVGV